MLYALLTATDDEVNGAESVTNPILPEWSEMVWGALAFTALYLLVRYVFLPSATRVMNDREATIRADLDAAEAARARAVTVSAEAQDQLAGVRAEAAAIIEAARAEAEAERERLVGRAEREVQAMRELAESEVERERAAALASIRPEVALLAVSAASKVMERQVDRASASPIIDRFLNNPN
ncbi:MAG: F0F1 ATP synthase subunit B [Acidimicrobiales bacterium]